MPPAWPRRLNPAPALLDLAGEARRWARRCGRRVGERSSSDRVRCRSSRYARGAPQTSAAASARELLWGLRKHRGRRPARQRPLAPPALRAPGAWSLIRSRENEARALEAAGNRGERESGRPVPSSPQCGRARGRRACRRSRRAAAAAGTRPSRSQAALPPREAVRDASGEPCLIRRRDVQRGRATQHPPLPEEVATAFCSRPRRRSHGSRAPCGDTTYGTPRRLAAAAATRCG